MRKRRGMKTLNYLKLFLRGFGMVMLVAANTYQISHFHLAGAGSIGMAISVLWFYNAKKAAHSELRWAGFVYGAGAGAGTMVGMELAAILWGGR